VGVATAEDVRGAREDCGVKYVNVFILGFDDPIQLAGEELHLRVRDNKALEVKDGDGVPISVFADGYWLHAHHVVHHG
jgi:hypothetical protein